MTDTDEVFCVNCRYHRAPDGTCHFDPPVRLPRRFDESATAGNRVRDEELLWGWPVVKEDDWCGKGVCWK
jgi:hypothetical protein